MKVRLAKFSVNLERGWAVPLAVQAYPCTSLHSFPGLCQGQATSPPHALSYSFNKHQSTCYITRGSQIYRGPDRLRPLERQQQVGEVTDELII